MTTGARRLLTAGDAGLLVEVAGLDEVIGLTRALEQARPAGVLEVIPAARTLLVRFDPTRSSRAVVAGWVAGAQPVDAVPADPPATVHIPVHYDGADLAEVGRLTGLSVAEVIGGHTGAVYTVAFCGFAPGFAYLAGLPRTLEVPRRPSPRTLVPAGAVAIADRFSSVYPTASPGGWQLIGRTDTTMFDLANDPPALLAPGTRVRFVAQPQ